MKERQGTILLNGADNSDLSVRFPSDVFLREGDDLAVLTDGILTVEGGAGDDTLISEAGTHDIFGGTGEVVLDFGPVFSLAKMDQGLI